MEGTIEKYSREDRIERAYLKDAFYDACRYVAAHCEICSRCNDMRLEPCATGRRMLERSEQLRVRIEEQEADC